MNLRIKIVVFAGMTASLLLPAFAPAQSNSAAPAKASDNSKTGAKKMDSVPPPSAQEIQDARSHGMVWVNLGTRVYHTDGEYYGKTKHGKFMSEEEAKATGFKAAQEPVGSKKKTISKPAANNSGTDATIATHGGETKKP